MSTASSGRPRKATMAPTEIDLTNSDDEKAARESDDDVQIVSATTRKPVTKAPQAKKTTPSGGSNPAAAFLSALTQRKKVNIDLRSDTSSPLPGSKSRRKERAHEARSVPKTEPAARKSGSSGPPPHIGRNLVTMIDDSSSSEDLPDIQFNPKSTSSGSSALPKQGPSRAVGSSSGAPKRRLETGSSSPASIQPSKRARLDESSASGRLKESSETAKKDATQLRAQDVLLGSFNRPSPKASKQNLASDAGPAKRSPLPINNGDKRDQKSSSPFGSQRSNGTKRPNPLADLRASEEKRTARQQSSSQEDTIKSFCAQIGMPGRPAVSQQTRNGEVPTSQPRSQPSTQADSGRPNSPRTAEPRRAGNEVLNTKARTPPPKQPVRQTNRAPAEVISEPSRALKLLNQRSNAREEQRPKGKQTGSSDGDQGYVSQSSGSAEDPGGKRRQGSGSPTSPLRNKATTHAGDSNGALGKGKGDTVESRSAKSSPGRAAKPHGKVLMEPHENDKVAEVMAKSDEIMEKTTTSAPADAAKSPPENGSALHSRSEKPHDQFLETSGDVAKAVETPEGGTSPKVQPPRFEAATESAEADDQLQSEALRAQSNSVFAVPHSAASALKSTAAYDKLSLAAKVEKVLGQYLEELAEDNEYWTNASLMRARISKEEEPTEEAEQEQEPEPTSFRHLKPLKLSSAQKDDPRALTWGIEKMVNGKPTSSERVTAPRQTFRTDAQDVPSYAHYVSITNNILAQNTKTLHCWPYFGDDFDNAKAENLKEQYHLDIEGREQKLLRLRQAQKYEEYVESALTDLGCSWADVLRFLLEPRPIVGINPDAIKANNNRNEFCKEEFDRYNRRWVAVLSSLPPSTTERVALAAVLCDNFQKLARFPLWHIARRSEFCRLPDKHPLPEDLTPASDELTCRICLRFNCPYHGELNEHVDREDDDDESDSSSVSVVATDLVHPPKANYRTRVAFPPMLSAFEDREGHAHRPEKKELRYWQNFQNKADARGPFYPCFHPGLSCDDEDADCSCYAENLPCEKFCGCDPACSRKFQGCSCSTQRIRVGKRGPCFDDERCACWQLGRECDPDLCRGCGVCEVIDPVNKQDQDVPRGRCQNASIQRGMPKCTLLGDSGVHGLGLYACENIQSNDFVGEYKGEIITKEEAERRGAVYEHQKLSYLFSLNKDQEIDSTYFGNKIRFINHASDGKANLYPRIIMVNTVHRIALYAVRSIKKGEELLFNYGPMFPDEQLGGKNKKGKKSAPHVRNANLVKEFYDIEEDEDELGNMRAKRVPSGAGGRKARKPKPRGGARPGAGRKPRKKSLEQSAAPEPGHQREESPAFEDEFADQDAGQRLAAYNVADDRAEDQMDVDIEAGLGAVEDEEDEEYHESGEEESEGSEESESDEDEGGEVETVARRRPGRPSARRSWRT